MGLARIILASAIIACMPIGAQAQTVGVIISGRADQTAAIAAVIERIAANPGAARAIVSASHFSKCYGENFDKSPRDERREAA